MGLQARYSYFLQHHATVLALVFFGFHHLMRLVSGGAGGRCVVRQPVSPSRLAAAFLSASLKRRSPDSSDALEARPKIDLTVEKLDR